jgi:hypothetical protein
MEQWAARQFQGETRDEILTLNAAALGELEAYGRLMTMSLEDFNETIIEEPEKVDDK